MSGFNGTPFNPEQLSYMRWLGTQTPESLSWCGWGRSGDPHCCCNPDCIGKREGKTLADKMLVWCPECHNEPREGVIAHRIGCSHRTAQAQPGKEE